MMKKTFASILLKFVKFASGSITSPFKNMRRSYDEACEYFGEANLHAGKTIPVTATCFMGISFAIFSLVMTIFFYVFVVPAIAAITTPFLIAEAPPVIATAISSIANAMSVVSTVYTGKLASIGVTGTTASIVLTTTTTLVSGFVERIWHGAKNSRHHTHHSQKHARHK